MSKFSKIIVFVALALIASSHLAYGEENLSATDFSEEESKDYIRQFQRDFAKQMENEFGLQWKEEEGSKRNLDNLPFYAHRRATHEEARALALAVINKLSEAVQRDPIMLSYISKLSSPPKFLNLNIHFVPSYNWGYEDGSIDSVYSYYSEKDTPGVKKLYFHFYPSNPFSDFSDDENVYRNITESFDDAVKLHALNPIINPAIHNPKEFEDELNETLTSFNEEMKDKYNLKMWSIGWMEAGNSTSEIAQIQGKCTYRYCVNHLEARALMFTTVQDLLNALNNNEKLKPYIKDYPFSANGIKFRILFREHKYFAGDVPYYGSLDSVVLNEGIITYYHHIFNKNSKMHDRVIFAKETYQEAKDSLEKAPPVKLSGANGIINFISDSMYYLGLVFIVLLMLFLFM